MVTSTDGAQREYDTILWATGFHASLPFLDEKLIQRRNGVPLRYASGLVPVGLERLYYIGLSAPRGPQIPIYGVQTKLAIRMIALHEAAGEGGTDVQAYLCGPRQLITEQRHAETRHHEAAERLAAELEQQRLASLRGGVPADQIPEGVAPAAAMLQAARDGSEAPHATRGGPQQRRGADVPPHQGRVMSTGLPRPLAADGAVTVDARERALVVRPAPDARAYVKVLWSEGVRAQAEAAASRYPGAAPTVWASGGGQTKVVFGLPATTAQ